jgi:hypothetical protein
MAVSRTADHVRPLPSKEQGRLRGKTGRPVRPHDDTRAEDSLVRDLVREGLIVSVPRQKCVAGTRQKRKLAQVKGKLLSQSIIEERR